MTHPFYHPLPVGFVPTTEAVPIGPLETRRARRARIEAAEASLRRGFDDLDAALALEADARSEPEPDATRVQRVSVFASHDVGVVSHEIQRT